MTKSATIISNLLGRSCVPATLITAVIAWVLVAAALTPGIVLAQSECDTPTPPPDCPAVDDTPAAGGSGSVVTTIEAMEAPGPCLLLSAERIDYGVLSFSTPQTLRSAAGEVTISNCSTETEDIMAQGTDAVGSAAVWTLTTPPGSGNMCSAIGGGVDRFAHTISDGLAAPLALTTAQQTYRSSVPSGGVVVTATTFHMPCSGSDGAGELLSTRLTFTAVTAAP
jgi:hypothetical protein